ncbi:hypothetical protein [Phocaeicola sartorii]|uniref:hypothetical protein n=1 Tax=Phocaeicola sartorii TaxID=671267 RepID=UPI00242D30BB|nr:hypothetical protein [Phocaeicola sartorii]
MYNKIYVLTPVIPATGGTELLQQLVFKLRQFGADAYIYYLDIYEDSPVYTVFNSHYNNPIATEIEDKANNVMIVPENAITYLFKHKRIQKAVWWLSVDNYKGANMKKSDIFHTVYRCLYDRYVRFVDRKWIHFVQSEYAYIYCTEKRHILADRIFHLSDYLNKTFIESASSVVPQSRKNQILYNPRKGCEFTKKLIQQASNLLWIPIQNMSAEEVKNLMLESKIYIDFGNHPGKDRIPREAAICGMCIITGLKGAAGNSVDVAIPAKYKFEENNIDEIISCINFMLNNFEDVKCDFDLYREKIKKEESLFEYEIKRHLMGWNDIEKC